MTNYLLCRITTSSDNGLIIINIGCQSFESNYIRGPRIKFVLPIFKSIYFAPTFRNRNCFIEQNINGIKMFFEVFEVGLLLDSLNIQVVTLFLYFKHLVWQGRRRFQGILRR